jgi:hypothetical protein
MAPDSKPPSYSYEPLVHEKSFRTLELFAGEKDEPLRGSLRIQTLETVPCVTGGSNWSVEYEILSYVWGSDTLSHQIHLDDGKVLAITANLHAALRTLRLADSPRLLWADGICINQKDNDEKGRQVSRMGTFYQAAKQCLIILGEEKDGSEQVAPLVEAIEDNMSLPGQNGHNIFGSAWRRGKELPADDDPAWKVLSALFLRPWWTRVWIIQELIKTEDAVLICGDSYLNWEPFAAAVKWAYQNQLVTGFDGDEIDKNAPCHDGLRAFTNLVVLRASMWENRSVPTWSLVDLLERCRSSRATDERDYIYSLLGLSMEAHGLRPGIMHNMMANHTVLGYDPPSLTPDFKEEILAANYDETGSETFKRYAGYMIRWGDGVKVLYSAAHGRERTDMPSWVPNWSAKDVPFRTLAPKNDGGVNPWYCAATGEEAYMRLSTVDDRLIVRGIVVDTITKVGGLTSRERQPNQLDPEGTFTRDLESVALAHADLAEFLEGKSTYPQDESMSVEEATWRTICCDLDASENNTRPPASMGPLLEPTVLYANQWDDVLQGLTDELGGGMSDEEFEQWTDIARFFAMRSAPFVLERRACITETGYVGMVDGGAKPGDVVFIPLGSAIPFVLRPGVDGYGLVGEGFVLGVMGGEVIGRREAEEITLV